MYLTIDNVKLIPIAKCETIEQAELWAQVKCKGDFLITGVDFKDFTFTYRDAELATMITNLSGDWAKRAEGLAQKSRDELCNILHREVAMLPVNEDAVEQLSKRVRYPVDVTVPDAIDTSPVPSPEQPRAPRTPREPSEGPATRPSKGATARVWEVADSMPGATRAEVVAACVAEGINKSTAGVQYGKWAKAQG